MLAEQNGVDTKSGVTWELTVKEMRISGFSGSNSFPPPVSILQEPGLLRPAAAHAVRLLHVHLHNLTSFLKKLCQNSIPA